MPWFGGELVMAFELDVNGSRAQLSPTSPLCRTPLPLYHPGIHPGQIGQLSLVIPAGIGAMSTGDGFRRRREETASSVFRGSATFYLDCWHPGVTLLKALAVNLSRPSVRHGL